MKLLVCVLNETRRLNDLLKAMAELGISGATVLESQGMAGVLEKEAPVVAGLRHLVTQGRAFNYTILSVVEDDELADHTMKAIEDHLLPGTRPGTRGIAFTVQVDRFVRFHPFGQEILKGKQPEKKQPETASTFQRAMLAALKRAETAPPKLVTKLAKGLRALVESRQPSELKEKRRAPRVSCDYRVKATGDGLTVDGNLSDLGLFGLSFISPLELKPDSIWELSPPVEVEEEAPHTIRCRVEQCQPVDDTFHCGLVYEETPEKLSESWIAHLLRALGFSMGQFVQRRKLRRVPGPIPADFQSVDGEVSVPATISDIGIQGALVVAEVGWDKGTEVGLLVGPYKEHEAFFLDGVVVDTREDENGEFHHGVRFYPPEKERMDRLGRLVIELLRNPAVSDPA